MQNVLDKLKQIETPTEDQTAAIKSAEAMTTAPAEAVAEQTPAVTAESTYTEYTPTSTPQDIAKLAGVDTIAVVGDTLTTNESVETEEEVITEAQSPAQKAAFQKMLDAKKDKKEDKEEVEEVEEVKEEIEVHEDDAQEVVAEGPTRKDFQMVADLLKDNPDMADRKAKAQDYCDKFKAMNPRFDKERFMKACGVEEAYESIEEAYSPEHVADIIKKHEEAGHQVEMDPYKDEEAGFTVTFLDGKRRHYKYTDTGSKVTSLEPVDPLVDPNAPKRGRGRPTKEAVEETEVDELTRAFESKLAEELPEEVEQVNESVQVTQTVDDEGKESVNISAQGDHVDMVKQMMQLAGQPQGYEEYKGEEEPEAEEANEELANSPNPQTTDVDTQLNKMSGGLNGPKDKSALRGDSIKLHDDIDEGKDLLDLYKAYKG